MISTMKQFLFYGIKTFLILLCITAINNVVAQRVAFENSWGKQGSTLIEQNSQGVVVNFSVANYLISETNVDSKVMNTITMSGVLLQNSEGYPNVPGFSKYVAIPQGASVVARVVRKQTESVQDIEIAPAPRIPKDTDKGPLSFKKNTEVYSTNGLYPNNIVQVSEPSKIRGVDVVLVSVSPFQYNPITKELVINKDIEVELSFEGGNGKFGDDRLRSRWWDPIIRDAVINESSIPEKKVTNSTRTQSGYEYIIIVPDDPAFLSWADSIRVFRIKQGISTNVYTTTEIGGNTTTAIENFIDNAYNTWDIPPAACLLMADYGTTGNTITSPVWDNYCISDNFYADVDEDMMPDVVMARMTAQNETHLETMVTKFLNHERNPPTNPGFYDNPITAMGWQTERWFQICSEVIAGFFENSLGKSPMRENAIYQGNPGNTWSTAQNTATVVSYFGESGLNYIPDSPSYLTDWGGNATRINNDINNGAFVLQHRDHGNETGWGEPAYTSSSIDGLTNSDLIYVFSCNCLTGKFDISGECFAEKFHRYKYNGENSGALGIMAATEVSYSFVNDTYTWGIYDNMWTDFMPDYGTTPESRGALPGFATAAGKYFLQQSSWPYNTNNKEVTYYLFHHHGDAFMTLYTEVPVVNNVIHDNIALSGLDYFTIQANEGSLICLTVGETVIGISEGTGEPQDIPIALQEPGTLIDIVVTLQNNYRYENTVEVIPPDGPYCMYADHVLIDAGGNNNGTAEFDEEVYYTLTMKNLGSEDAINVDVTLSTDEYATFIDNSEIYDTIVIQGFETRENAYQIHISDGIPDQHVLNFEVLATDTDDSTWTSNFQTVVFAPTISPDVLLIDDSQSGNNNGMLDPGEIADMRVKVRNTGHCNISNVICNLTPYNPYITVNSGEQTIEALGLFGASYAVFNVTVADDAPNAIIAEMLFNASAAGYSVNETYYPKIGIFVEDWETGNFDKYDWKQDGDEPWEVIDLYPFEGIYHARSGVMGDNKTSELKITYEVLSSSDSIKFYKKISSEPDFDELKFYIDNTEVASWSGAESWTHEKFPVTSGNHTFRWVYAKDFGGIVGADCAWLDYIELPTMLVTTLFAGPDDDNCENAPYQCIGTATNQASVLWLTSGDGSFDFENILQPQYTPGTQDIENGDVVLTLTIVDVVGDSYEDEMTLSLIGAPNVPEVPMGPEYVDVYQIFETEYSVNKVAGGPIGYNWTITPEEAGTIISADTFAVVQWNTSYMGEALLSVQSSNSCGDSDFSEELIIIVDNTVGISNDITTAFNINIVPNPNNGVFKLEISSDNDNPITISMVNYLGLEVFIKEDVIANNGYTYYMEDKNLSSGIYIVNVQQGELSFSRKVLIGR